MVLVPIPEVNNVAHTIQLAVAPVFLLAGIGGFLNVCAGRLARIIDRARVIEPLLLAARGREHDRYVEEIRGLDDRITIVNWSIMLNVVSACLTCFVVIMLFANQLVDVKLGKFIALLFIASMISLAAAFALFIVETRMGSRIVRIRKDILDHQAEEEE